ncbi:MAG TPA: hypothetical protein VKZ96_00540 [Thermomicrobiales bacterium]|nr:hypothetical protein [Thermomicrobiales bacterium]
MRRFLNRRGEQTPQQEEVVRRQVISLAEPNDQPLASDERLRDEIRNLMKDQQPGRYRVRVRRRLVRL